MHACIIHTEKTLEYALATARCCYASMKYTKCIELCDKLPTSLEASLLKGKALYNLYQKRQRRLRKHTLQPKEFYIQHKACYDMAKEVVKIFSSTDVQLDADCSRMLDFAIMDYLLETNKLKELQFCFLCLKKPKIDGKAEAISEIEQEPSSNAMESGKKEVKPHPQKANIRASHLVPHAIIKRLMNELLPNVPSGSKNVLFGVSMQDQARELNEANTSQIHCVYALSIMWA